MAKILDRGMRGLSYRDVDDGAQYGLHQVACVPGK
jgi:hypothetical protein